MWEASWEATLYSESLRTEPKPKLSPEPLPNNVHVSQCFMLSE